MVVFFGILLAIGQSGRAGGVEVMLVVPVALLAAIATWRRLGRARRVVEPPDDPPGRP